jgi:hypothetical protein
MGLDLVFDGEICYICPHCGTEQRFVEAEWEARGYSCVSFRLSREGLEPSSSDIDPGEASEISVLDEFRCPGCKEPLAEFQIEQGFLKWLERLRKENPRKHAEVIARVL